MKVRREFVVLVLIIAALSLFIFFQKRGRKHYTLPELKKISAENITKMTIEKPGATITLERDGGRWLILPQRYPADGNLVGEMAAEIASIKLTALVSESKNYQIYELDEDHRTAVEISGDGGSLRKMDIGKTAPSHRHTFVKIEGDHRVYHASGNLTSAFDRTESSLRDTQVLHIDEEIGEISLREGEETLTIVRRTDGKSPASAAKADTETEKVEKGEGSKEGESIWITTEGKKAVDEAIDEIIDTVKNLRCDGFVEEKKKDDLKNPIFTLSLRGMGEYTLSFYEGKGDQYVATSSGSDYPFLLSEWKAKKIKKDPSALTAN